ncbi:zinc ABC transporter substrate-binding protein ZnuA [[Haemophilus] felis]|uniref:High-affinity zinc uptake system protein ZnuA n=1 Tax=[Haemophilus] felis TaxID=123822 RepID=A0A1T0AVS9_9PAST|nr:zinc ABC transporter substrate-binding protein ZnuA [[Haemophilus] felis]NBI40873.1 zinc ABC transporter substrate-binding protein ZnuA [[Haemophilus] felis]OOS00498.1 zinc ABC transporter substrate-binding protein [[Haemophilus] felis]
MLKHSLVKTSLAFAVASFAAGASANIVTSIKPLGFIASSIADGVTGTEVLVPAGASPHDYSLKPSDVAKLKKAELVLWIGKDVDSFLDDTLRPMPFKKVLTIADFNEIAPFLDHEDEDHDHDHDHEHAHKHEHHAHKHEHHDHDHDHDHEHHDHAHKHDHEHEHHGHDHHGHDHSTNWHVWYSAEISNAVAERLAKRLTENYPEKTAKIAQNLAEFKQSLAAQQAKIKQKLAPVKEKGFYVFHDAYSYFNEAYDLNQVGYFTINPLVAPGAKTLQKIKGEIKEHKVNCLFAEPQFTPKVIDSLRKGTGVNVGQLDPMGEKVKLGKNSYAAFLQYTADSYFSCLRK